MAYPDWFKRMSKAKQKEYLVEHPASRFATIAKSARKLYNSSYGKGAINTAIGYGAQGLGLGVLDAAREGKLPEIGENDSKRHPRTTIRKVRPHKSGKLSAAKQTTKKTQAERVKTSKARSRRRK